MADRQTTTHYGIVKYGPQGTADPMDVYAVYNEAMETIDRIIFDLQGQIARNKKAIEELDAKVERYNTALNTRIYKIYNKIEQYNAEFKQFKATTEQKFTQVDNHFTNLDGKTSNLWTAIRNVIAKVYGGGTVTEENGSIAWGDPGKAVVGNINVFSGTGYLRTRAGEQDNDVKVI